MSIQPFDERGLRRLEHGESTAAARGIADPTLARPFFFAVFFPAPAAPPKQRKLRRRQLRLLWNAANAQRSRGRDGQQR